MFRHIVYRFTSSSKFCFAFCGVFSRFADFVGGAVGEYQEEMEEKENKQRDEQQTKKQEEKSHHWIFSQQKLGKENYEIKAAAIILEPTCTNEHEF